MKSTLFKNNRTQAVRIPKSLQFPDGVKEVEIERHGDGLIVRAKRRFAGWSEFFARSSKPPKGSIAAPEDMPPQERKFPWD